MLRLCTRSLRPLRSSTSFTGNEYSDHSDHSDHSAYNRYNACNAYNEVASEVMSYEKRCVRFYSENAKLARLGLTEDVHSLKIDAIAKFPIEVQNFIREHVALCNPDSVVVITGDKEEEKLLEDMLVASGSLIRLKKREHSFLARSDPKDVARVEDKTFICSEEKSDAGPNNHWKEPSTAFKSISQKFKNCMKGRTMYVIPFSMGPVGSDLSKVGIELTDSAYVALNMRIMTRVGRNVWKQFKGEDFVKCVHSVGAPLNDKSADVPWPCNPAQTTIDHFPQTYEVYSFGSGYGGNALLGKKCFALRIASTLGRSQGWLAEHMLISGITNPKGVKKYIAASFPSACGKTNLAMLQPSLPGWKAECVGDDIAWMKIKNNKLYAINPESGFFGVAPGTSYDSNPNAMETITKNTLFTNVALTPDGDVWWEGMTKNPPDHLTDWHGKPWTPASKELAAHGNSRFTVSAAQCPAIDDKWDDPEGVPISAILFGGRRGDTIPLVYKARDWNHGVFMGASMRSETTAAAVGATGVVRNDPFAMKPFCGYNMGDYFNHWLEIGASNKKAELPDFYYVNWFRKNKNGKFLWPGFGQNVRVLKWILEDSGDKNKRVDSPIGFLPTENSLDLKGTNVTEGDVKELLDVKKDEWKKEVTGITTYFEEYGSKIPKALWNELNHIKEQIN